MIPDARGDIHLSVQMPGALRPHPPEFERLPHFPLLPILPGHGRLFSELPARHLAG